MSEYTKKSLPFTLVAHAGIALFILIFANATDFNGLWKIVFIAIGALTAAHSPVMTRFLFQVDKRKRTSVKTRRHGPSRILSESAVNERSL